MRNYLCLPSDFFSTLLRCCIPGQRALILSSFSSCRAVFQATATAYPASSSNWVKNEWRKGAVQICNSVWSETNGTLCTLGVQMSAVPADGPLLQQEGPCFPSAQTIPTTWITYYSNLNSLFSENKLLETIFFVAVFLSFFLHVIQSLMKSRLLSGWQRNIHCWVVTTMTSHHLKKTAVQQLSRHQVSYIRNDRHRLCKYQTSFTWQGKKISS